MHGLEQEVASAAHFVISALDGVSPYYWEMPADFMVPAVFFPTPEIDTAGDSLDTYEMAYTWHVKLFHKTDGEAQNLAQAALVAIKNARNCLPLYNEDGSAVGKRFRVLDPSIKRVDRGAWQLELRWHSPRYFDEDEKTLARVLDFNINDTDEVVQSEELPEEPVEPPVEPTEEPTEEPTQEPTDEPTDEPQGNGESD